MLKKCLQYASIISPIIILFISVFNFPLPKHKFAYWGISTLLVEVFLYFMYITLKKSGDC